MVKTIEERYEKLTPREHILLKPGMYIGSISNEIRNTYIVEDINANEIKIISKLVNYNPGFFKLFDEILVNSSDHYIRTKGKVKYIKINVFENYISIENDGEGIPIQEHKKFKCLVPELIFGHLLSGENFKEDEKRIVGGTHGIGSKAVNVFSTRFIVETADGKNKYYQEFINNLEKASKPKIEPSNKNYTKITYYPDFKRFGIDIITNDMQKIMFKRACDVVAYCPKVKVYYNDKLINIKSFEDYAKLYVGKDANFYYDKLNDDWEVGITQSIDDNFAQVSLVNGINTSMGGSHVNLITNQIVTGIKEAIEKKHKKIVIKPNDIKNKLFLFLNSKVVNPDFDSQTKETLKTKLTPDNIGNIQISEKFIKELSQSSIVQDIIDFINLKEKAELAKLTKGKVSKVKIRKLDDANRAGTSESHLSNLMLTEGDSALTTCITGFSETGRDYFGAFPLKGKLLNVRDIDLKKIKDEKSSTGEEIRSIVNALGLEFGKKYTSTKELRYGKLTIFTDSDEDGYHIKGLLINLFDTFWKELLEMDFIYEFVSPIVKIEKNKKKKFFYKLSDYKKWKILNEKGYEITYYKGLGTIEPDEIREFFRNLDKHLIRFNLNNKEKTYEIIDLLFNKKRADERKDWLLQYNPVEIDKFSTKTTYESFFNHEFIEFSMADNIRSIPSIMDGFKPSQRKILYVFLKNNISKSKVSSICGKVSAESAYHHSQVSLEQGLIQMAQNFVGSNNINLLEPHGAFGTRLKGGKDSASSRYIFTKLSDITEYIYRKEDNDILEYLNDDGFPIEPKFYLPIIPMSLINNNSGIGTGWSSDIPQYNIIDIMKYLGCKLKDSKTIELKPYYNKFKGEIIFEPENKRYVTRGIIKKMNASTVKISELPIGMWNDSYYEFLDKLENDKIIKDYIKNDTDEIVDITINIDREQLKQIEESNNYYKVFGLETYISINNMHLFNHEGKIKKYESVYEILDEFYEIRLTYYQKRKDYLISKLNQDKLVLLNKMKFINLILKGEIKINNVKKADIEQKLEEFELMKVEDSYGYLLNMSIVSLTAEKLIEFSETFKRKKEEIQVLEETSIKQIWMNDLAELFKKLKK